MKSIFNSNFYQQLPVDFQETILSLRSKVRRFVREDNWIVDFYKKQLDENELMSMEEIKAVQLIKLQKIMRFSQNHVPYYKNLFKSIGFSYHDLSSLDDIKELPFLTKETVQKNADKFLPNFPYKLFCKSGTTSGTSGMPLKIYHDFLSIMFERAVQKRLGQWAGYSPGQKKVWLRGDLIVPVEQKKPPFWRFNKDENQLMMSSYHISETTLPEYINQLSEFQPQLISAFPSSLFTIAKYMSNHGYNKIKVGGIVTSSETLYPEWRKVIEEMFCCRVYDWYGHYERVSAICSCEYGHYHIIEDYGFTELIDLYEDYCEIVSTGFHNHGFPLIRYKTGDMVKVKSRNDFTCQCGSNFRHVESIVGRMNDYIVLKNGRKFQGLGFIFKHPSIIEGQIYQYRDYSIEIRIIPNQTITTKDKHIIKNLALARFGVDTAVDVVCVPSIERLSRGKFKAIISEIES